jgi:hypothetical protein
MRNALPILLTTLVLAGCQQDLEARERDDDASCRKIITERNDTRPNAYQECRAHLMDYRRNKAIAASG